ncbi:hypothetical protein NG796_14105 [Laspinema sp. A4]|uniref:hypothetical protein n=1 Tax=Laspinema sp. D2d TaxID=2953686 RepID=UPI0021BA95E0|nr:hypothetical protein [Laspinema sp. D2d]MCT7984430.1 hypothetical protein [Laspinema sp. D2d]
MENLVSKIRTDLNAYQTHVSEKLIDLRSQGLISETEFKKIIVDAQLTAKSIIDGLASQDKYTEKATEIYVYSLLDKYRNKIENKIRKIEEKQKVIKFPGKQGIIEIYFKNEAGQLIIPDKMDREIAETFLENVLKIPAKSVTIVVGHLIRILKIRLEEKKGHHFFNSNAYTNKLEQEKKVIEMIYQEFGKFIGQIVDGEYPDEDKYKYQNELLEEMVKVAIDRQNLNQGFLDKLFSILNSKLN